MDSGFSYLLLTNINRILVNDGDNRLQYNANITIAEQKWNEIFIVCYGMAVAGYKHKQSIKIEMSHKMNEEMKRTF